MAKTEYRSAVRSRKLIKAALADLLQEKPLDKITVTDVVNRAEINRGTFYTHYKDIPDVIDHLIQETFVKITQALPKSSQEMVRIPEILTRKIQEIMNEDYSFYQKLMNSSASQLMRIRLTDVLLEYLMARESTFSNMDHEEYVMMIRFCAGGMGALYHDWFTGKLDSLPLDQLTERTEKILKKLMSY